MNLQHYYWVFDKIIPDRICDEIKRLGITIEAQLAMTGGFSSDTMNQDRMKQLKQKRDSHIVWMDDRWIHNLIQPCVKLANKNG